MTTSYQKEQAERASLAGSSTGMTYHSRAITGLDLERSGRHAQHATVIGSKPAVAYPRLPENNPFTTDISGVEPPLGYEINAQEVNGTPQEVEQSLIAASVRFPSDADEAREVDATPPLRAAPTSGSLSPQEVGVPSLIRGRRL
jgi:hypothetical protein